MAGFVAAGHSMAAAVRKIPPEVPFSVFCGAVIGTSLWSAMYNPPDVLQHVHGEEIVMAVCIGNGKHACIRSVFDAKVFSVWGDPTHIQVLVAESLSLLDVQKVASAAIVSKHRRRQGLANTAPHNARDPGFGLALFAVYSYCIGGECIEDDGTCTFEVWNGTLVLGRGKHHSVAIDVSPIFASRVCGTGISNETTASADNADNFVKVRTLVFADYLLDLGLRDVDTVQATLPYDVSVEKTFVGLEFRFFEEQFEV